MRWRRGALCLTNFLPKPAILGFKGRSATSSLGFSPMSAPLRPHFLTNFLSNPAIVLAVLPSGAGVQQRLNHKHCSGHYQRKPNWSVDVSLRRFESFPLRLEGRGTTTHRARV